MRRTSAFTKACSSCSSPSGSGIPMGLSGCSTAGSQCTQASLRPGRTTGTRMRCPSLCRRVSASMMGGSDLVGRYAAMVPGEWRRCAMASRMWRVKRLVIRCCPCSPRWLRAVRRCGRIWERRISLSRAISSALAPASELLVAAVVLRGMVCPIGIAGEVLYGVGESGSMG